jgi:hypothetical protein
MVNVFSHFFTFFERNIFAEKKERKRKGKEEDPSSMKETGEF